MINLFFDTETSDMINFKARNSDSSQPWICQLAAKQVTDKGRVINSISLLIKSTGLPMAKEAQDVHGWSIKQCDLFGLHPGTAYDLFIKMLEESDNLIAHNISFDFRLLKILGRRLDLEFDYNAYKDLEEALEGVRQICTMKPTTKYCQLPYPSGRKGCKWPKLEELYFILFREELVDAHDAMVDVDATIKCYFELKKRKVM